MKKRDDTQWNLLDKLLFRSRFRMTALEGLIYTAAQQLTSPADVLDIQRQVYRALRRHSD